MTTMKHLTNHKRENWFDSFNYRIFTPDATLFVLITEGHDGEPMSVFITGAKHGQPLQAWIYAVQEFINYMLRKKEHISRIITLLDVPYTPKYAQNSDGIKIYSGPDGIKWALTRYLQEKTMRVNLNVGSRLG